MITISIKKAIAKRPSWGRYISVEKLHMTGRLAYYGDNLHLLSKLVLITTSDPVPVTTCVRHASDACKHITRGHDK
jgi:hypothetical protein